MGDYGTSSSQKGYDVKTCADRFLVYSSAFPLLKVFSSSSVSTTIPVAGTNTITITHNLGYYAPFLVVYNGSTTIGQGTSYLMSEGIGLPLDYRKVQMYINKLEITIDNTFNSTVSNVGDTVYFTVYILLDNFDSYSADNINTGVASGASSSDEGIRISKSGFDVKTTDDVNCVLSSSFFTNIIHKKGNTLTSPIAHNLGYIPAVLAYIKKSGASYISYPLFSTSATSTNIYMSLAAGDRAYYIIFKNKNG